VVVSGISYFSYLLKRYVFKESGTFVSGILGGLYSSTATISVLARKSKAVEDEGKMEYVAAMLMAISMMFLRFLILIGIFSKETLQIVFPFLLAMAIVAGLLGYWLHYRFKSKQTAETLLEDEKADSNPLEFKVALIFATLFVVFTLITHFTILYLGEGGLNVLSFVVGLSDITPFILNLVQNPSTVVPFTTIAACSMQAIISNICLNMCYALFFSGKNASMRKLIWRAFGAVIIVNAILLVIFYFVVR